MRIRRFSFQALICLSLFRGVICPGQTATNGAPVFLTQPTNQLAPVFGWAILSAQVEGSAPLSFQWRFNGVDIPAATNSSLLLGPLSSTQAGDYNLVASNALGQASSTKANVVVAQAIMSTNSYWVGLTGTNQSFLLQFTNLVAAYMFSGSIVAGLQSDGTIVSEYYPTSVLPTVSVLGGINLAVEEDGTAVAWGWDYFTSGEPPPLVVTLASNVVASECQG